MQFKSSIVVIDDLAASDLPVFEVTIPNVGWIGCVWIEDGGTWQAIDAKSVQSDEGFETAHHAAAWLEGYR